MAAGMVWFQDVRSRYLWSLVGHHVGRSG